MESGAGRGCPRRSKEGLPARSFAEHGEEGGARQSRRVDELLRRAQCRTEFRSGSCDFGRFSAIPGPRYGVVQLRMGVNQAQFKWVAGRIPGVCTAVRATDGGGGSFLYLPMPGEPSLFAARIDMRSVLADTASLILRVVPEEGTGWYRFLSDGARLARICLTITAGVRQVVRKVRTGFRRLFRREVFLSSQGRYQREGRLRL